MQTPADGRDHVGQLDERKSRPEPTQTHCKANADAWSDALGEYERLLDEIGRLQTERQAARELRKALDRDWEKRKTHSPTDQERMVEGSKLVQKESDLWREEEAIRNQLRVLDQRKLDIWNRHKGCPDALPGDPNALAY